MRNFAGQLAALAAALSRSGDGALRKLLTNRESSDIGAVGLQSARRELHGALTQLSTEVTKFAMLFKNAASVSDASGLAVADRVERATVGAVLMTARLAADVSTCAPLRRELQQRCHFLLDALDDVVQAAVSRVALGVRMLDLDQIGAVFNGCEQLQALCGDAANRDVSDAFLKSVAELVKDARSELQDLVDVEADDDDEYRDDEDDGDDEDLRDVAMSADEKARAERALAVISCVGVLVLQAQALLAAAGESRPVALVDAVAAAVEGVSALVDSLTAALCPPQAADDVAAAMQALEAAAQAAGDSLLAQAPADAGTHKVLQATLAKLRHPLS